MTRHARRTLCLFAALSMLGAPQASAQDGAAAPLDAAVFSNTTNQPRVTLDKADDELYKGVIPGKRDEKDHISRSLNKKKKAARRVDNTLTWIGFRAEERRTRIFIQGTSTPSYDVVRDDTGSQITLCLLYTSPSPRDRTRSRMPSSA